MSKYTIGKDVGSLEMRVRALEAKDGGCGCSGEDGSKPRMAMQSDSEPTEELSMRPDPLAPLAACTNGHIRTVTVNGKRYCQMCCGGQWQYFCWANGECVQPSHGPVTVNCAGNNWILDCH